MKIINWVGHPVVMIVLYLLLIIEGDHFGGFYLLYLLLALPHGALYAITAAAGIALLIAGHQIKNMRWKQGLYMIGFTLMATSLFSFFGRSKQTGVDATFDHTVPLLTFILLCISGACFVTRFFTSDLKLNNTRGISL